METIKKLSDLAGSWKMSEKEAKNFLKTIKTNNKKHFSRIPGLVIL